VALSAIRLNAFAISVSFSTFSPPLGTQGKMQMVNASEPNLGSNGPQKESVNEKAGKAGVCERVVHAIRIGFGDDRNVQWNHP
jgi:hypothetical protein